VLPLGVILQKKFGDKRPIIYALFTNAIALGIVSFCMSGCKTNALQNLNFELIKAGFWIAIFDIMECAGVYVACKLANVALLQPMRFTRIIFAVFVSQIVLGETLTIYQIIGTIIIFIANFLAIFAGRFLTKR
jgi:drug/metabolite transporter (DMT)-like permease